MSRNHERESSSQGTSPEESFLTETASPGSSADKASLNEPSSPKSSPGEPSLHKSSLRREIADFWHFLRTPSLRHGPPAVRRGGAGLFRMSGTGGWTYVRRYVQGVTSFSIKRLLVWVSLLWGINLFALGPLAATVATLSGVHHKLQITTIPWFAAVVWAPVVEEMVFRYGLRHPQQIAWVIPLMLWPLVRGPARITLVLVILVLFLAVFMTRRQRTTQWQWRWRRHYVRQFPWILHGAALIFASMHWGNFSGLTRMSLWLLPLLVLPQWLTGLVLSWTRVRRGICASILMHSLFNAGPLLLILGLWKWMPRL